MGRRRSYMLAFEGIVKNLERRYRETDSSQQRERIEEYMTFQPCPQCGGARLKPEVLAVTVGERNIHEFTRMSVTRAIEFLDGPAIGLHQRDNGKLIGTLERLRDLGNTVLVVEHDEQMMRAADHLVDMGPGAGEHGGHGVAEGPATKIERNADSITGLFLAGKREIAVPERRGEENGSFWVRGASMHNLKGIDVEFPVGKFICVTGVSGSGKSTLVNEIVYKALANRLHRLRVKPGEHASCEGIECYDKV